MAKPEGLRVGGAGTAGTQQLTIHKLRSLKSTEKLKIQFGVDSVNHQGDQEIGAEYGRLPRNLKELAS